MSPAAADSVLAIEIRPMDLAAIESALSVLECAGVPIVRIPADSPLGPAGPLFAVCEATSPMPVKYVFYIRLPAREVSS